MTSNPRPIYDRMAGRVSFDLNYVRSSHRRHIQPGYLEGSRDQTDDARAPGRKSKLGWNLDTTAPMQDGSFDSFAPPEAWLFHYFSLAVGEGVHEILEWFHLDGKPLIDPHADQGLDDAIIALCDEFARKLFERRRLYAD